MNRYAIVNNTTKLIENFAIGDAPPVTDAGHTAVPDTASGTGWTYDLVGLVPSPPPKPPPLQRLVTWNDLVTAGVVLPAVVPKT